MDSQVKDRNVVDFWNGQNSPTNPLYANFHLERSFILLGAKVPVQLMTVIMEGRFRENHTGSNRI